jgi:hypothetical protein
MPIGNPQTLEERVETLEQTLLALNCFSNLVNAAERGHAQDVAMSDVAFLLEYLSEESLYKVEAIRMMTNPRPAPSPLAAA